MEPSSLTPWKPATTGTLPAATQASTASALICRILAREWLVLVSIPHWAPVKDMAGTPRFCRAMAKREMVFCSPVAMRASISRGQIFSPTWLARAIS